MFVYLALLARHAVDEGHDVICLISDEGREAIEFERHLRPVGGISVTSVPSPLLLRNIVAVSAENQSDVVVIPNGDVFVTDVAREGWAGRGVLRLLVMRDPRWERPASLIRRLRLRTKSALIRVAASRGAEVVWLRQPGYSGPEVHVNDPVIIDGDVAGVVTRGHALRQALSMGTETFWFGMTGAISPHKNLDLVLHALAAVQRRGPDRPFGFALIGPLSESLGQREDEIIAALDALPFPTRRRSGVMTNEEMNAAVAAVDCVIMAYSTSSPNSTLGKAVALGTLVAAAGDGSIATFVSDLGMGPTAALTVDGLAALLAERLTSSKPHPREDILLDQFCGILVSPPHASGV
ncbi:hypothetical protein [Oryzobacter telluris]|uniref:hypothetical protein n=1 Tax=Oryzobacter telluris TaxID=3149179 RepID=UPI00370DA175